MARISGIKVPIWLVVEVKEAHQIFAVNSRDHRMSEFGDIYKGATGKFIMGYQRMEAEILDMFDEIMAKAVAKNLNDWNHRRLRRRIDPPGCAAGPDPKISAEQRDQFSKRFKLFELQVEDESAKNDFFRSKIEETLDIFRTELDRIKALPANRVLQEPSSPSNAEKSFRYIAKEEVDEFFKDSKGDHGVFFDNVSTTILTPYERTCGIRKIPQDKLFELENILSKYYPQGSADEDLKLWKSYKQKMTIYAANRRRTWPYKSTRKNKKRQKTSKNDDFSEENSNSANDEERSQEFSSQDPMEILRQFLQTSAAE